MNKMRKPLDPEPWSCWPMNTYPGTVEIRHTRNHEGYVEFEPRPEYEQDEDAYPEEVFQ